MAGRPDNYLQMLEGMYSKEREKFPSRTQSMKLRDGKNVCFLSGNTVEVETYGISNKGSSREKVEKQ